MMDSLRALLIALGYVIGSGAAGAQPGAYPSKPIRVIVSLAAGSSADIVTRTITPRLAEALGQPFVVENRVGFSGNIGAEQAARATPDGYTLLVAYAGNAISQTLVAKLGYSLTRDFEAVGMIGSLPLALVVHPSLPAKTVTELVALSQARPKQLYYASPGNGSLPHLAAELFKVKSRTDIFHIPYKSTTQAVTELIGGQTAVMFAAPLSTLPHAQAGRLRMLAVSSAKRSAVAPQLPTIAESGLAGFDVSQWYGVLAPAGTAHDIVARLNAALATALRTPEIRERLAKGGVDPVTSTPAQFASYVQAEIAKWADAVKASGARAD